MTAAIQLPNETVYHEPAPALLRHLALTLGECQETREGALLLRTGKHTGRSPNDRFIVKDATTLDQVAWGKSNQALSTENFRALHHHVLNFLKHRTRYQQRRHAGGAAGAPLHIISTSAIHSLFCRFLFQRPGTAASESKPITVLHVPECFAIPEQHGTSSGTFVVLNLTARIILIGGTAYAGELKKSVFSFLNYELPARGILPMHAAVNVGARGDSAVFFGLSGTGKTTLSADPRRFLVGDDEHAWSETEVFNLEGGCYAKTIGVKKELEPEIWRAIHQPDAILENVIIDESGAVNWDDASICENTRAAYPLTALRRVWPRHATAAPKRVIFLTADAFGVLPSVARLSTEQALYYFLSGYTAKLAGTERGVVTPEPTFSTCFGAPFMPRSPAVYAELLRKRVEACGAKVWLVNTGWIGGPYGEGRRIPIDVTRAIVSAILSGSLDDAPHRCVSRFQLSVPTAIPGVPSVALRPRSSWRDPPRYDQQGADLVGKFVRNFAQHEPHVSRDIIAAGPQ